MDIKKILNALPHRYPFLLVDRVVEIVPNGKVLSGIPAFDNREWLRSTAAFRRLGEMQRTIRALEQRLAALEKPGTAPQTED